MPASKLPSNFNVERLIPREVLEKMATSLSDYYALLSGADVIPVPVVTQIVLDTAAVFVQYALSVGMDDDGDD